MNQIHSNQPLEAAVQEYQRNSQQNKEVGKSKFKELLQKKLETEELKVSKHAQEKLLTRGINFDQQQLDKLKQAVSKGKEKGAKDSLVLVDNNAYIVSVENETVITAMDKNNMQDSVVTNIDSAIVME